MKTWEHLKSRMREHAAAAEASRCVEGSLENSRSSDQGSRTGKGLAWR